MKPYYLLACSGTDQLVKPIGKALNLPYGIVDTGKFPNQELRLQVPDVAQTTFLFGSLSYPVNTRIIEYLLAADALKRMGCQHVVGILSWYAYSKQDKVFLPGEPLSAKVVASLLQTVSIKELLCVELHNPSISGYFDIPVKNISAAPIFVNHLRNQNLDHTLVVSPDAGSIKNSTKFANELNLPIAYCSKIRDLHTGKVTITDINIDIHDRNILIFDDMVATGSTLIETSEFLKQKGAQKITICCTHHLYIPGVTDKLTAAPIDHLFVSNSIQPPTDIIAPNLSIIDISPILVEQIKPLLC